MTPQFFASPSELRARLARHHDKSKELWAGFYKKNSGKPSITWPEAVDAVLCFGWIDGVRRSIDEISYAIRLTPRQPRSTWSAINIKKVQEQTKLGLMRAAGIEAFQARVKEKSGIYSYEQRRNIKLDPPTKRNCGRARRLTNFSGHNRLGTSELPSSG